MVIKTFSKEQSNYDFNKLGEYLDSLYVLDEKNNIKYWNILGTFNSYNQPIRKQMFIDEMYKFIKLTPSRKIDVFLINGNDINEVELTLDEEEFDLKPTFYEDVIKELDKAHYYIFRIRDFDNIIIIEKTKSGDFNYSFTSLPKFKTRRLEEDEQGRILNLIRAEVSKNDYMRYRVNVFDRLYQDQKVKYIISLLDVAEYYIYRPFEIAHLIGQSEYVDADELGKFKSMLGLYNKEFYVIKYLDSVEQIYHVKSEEQITPQIFAKFLNKAYGVLENVGIYFPKTNMFFFVEEYNCCDALFAIDLNEKLDNL